MIYPLDYLMLFPFFLIMKQLTALILPNNSLILKQRPNTVLTFFLFNEMILARIKKGRFN